jgi:hypothetical protein
MRSKIKIIYSLYPLLSLVSFACCNPQESINTEEIYHYNQEEFDNRIRLLNAKVVDLTAPSDLFMFPEFIEVFENPQEYKKEALVLLSDSVADSIQKEIVIYSMLNLEYIDYIEVVETLAITFENELNEPGLLYVSIYSPFITEHPIISNYDTDEVIAILAKISRNEKSPDYLRDAIEMILSGELYANRRKAIY